MVPIYKEIPRYLYLVRPLKWQLWILLIFSAVYISLILNVFDWILLDNGRWRHDRFGKAVLNAIALIAHIPTTFKMDSAHWKHITGVYMFLFVFGFILTNYYTSLLSSFMTTTVFKSSLNTVDDLIEEGIPILAQDFDARILFFKDSKHDSLKIQSILNIVSPEEFHEQRNNFNQSFAYPISSDRWDFLTKQQTFLKRPLFRYSNICFSENLPVSFLMKYDNHLQDSLNHFALRMYATGILFYWVERDFEVAVMMQEMKRLQTHVELNPVTLETLLVAWLLLVVGLALSGISFAVEFCVHFLRKRKSDKTTVRNFAEQLRNM